MLPEQNEIKLIELFKVCTICKTPKLFTEFSEKPSGRFGVDSRCKTCRNSYFATYRKNHKKERQSLDKAYHSLHKEKRNAYGKAYYHSHKKEHNIRQNQRRENPKHRLTDNMSKGIRRSLKNGKCNTSWLNLVNYTVKKLRQHLEKLFAEGMTWKNYGKGGWEVDHKIPVSAFNFTKPEHRDFKRCWALKNLQPMWEKENKSKGDNLNKHFQPSLLL